MILGGARQGQYGFGCWQFGNDLGKENEKWQWGESQTATKRRPHNCHFGSHYATDDFGSDHLGYTHHFRCHDQVGQSPSEHFIPTGMEGQHPPNAS